MKYPIVCLFFLGMSSLAFAQSPCTSDTHRQFDFWVGQWKVYHTQADTLVGESHIKLILNDCVIEENWKGASGFEGKSFNTYNPMDSTWNQVWVDVAGNTYHFKGQYADQKMIMKGQTFQNGKIFTYEMSFQFNPKTGTVRQIWKQSDDEGKSWKTIFDGTYKKT